MNLIKTHIQLKRYAVKVAKKQGIKIKADLLSVIEYTTDGSGHIYRALILDRGEYVNYAITNNRGLMESFVRIPNGRLKHWQSYY